MNTRTGKIARLPRQTREELNNRLRDGESGRKLVDWLNEQPAAKEALAGMFDGREITEQNLSDWKQGGYADWLIQQEALERSKEMVQDAAELKKVFESGALTEHLSAILAVRYAAVLSGGRRTGDKEFEQDFKLLRAVCKDVVKLRKGDHSMKRYQLKLDWKWEVSGDDIVEIFQGWVERMDVKVALRLEWPDPARARQYLQQILKCELEEFGPRKQNNSNQ